MRTKISSSTIQIRIHPKFKVQFFELKFVYDKEPIETDLDAKKFLGIDFGLGNLTTCVTSDGSAFIVDGKNLKSYNRLYNKENARLQTPKDKQGIKEMTRRQYLNLRKRESFRYFKVGHRALTVPTLLKRVFGQRKEKVDDSRKKYLHPHNG